MSSELLELLRRPFHPRLLVVGDVILDRYLFGTATRISPEAPIPLLRVTRQEDRLGGAGSVASMLAALEVRVALAAVWGDDADGLRLQQLLLDLGVALDASLVTRQRPTTVKQRILGLAQARHPQQLLRVDAEDDKPLDALTQKELAGKIAHEIERSDLVLISDYNKGVCAEGMIPKIIALAAQRGVKVVADPIRGGDYRRYAGCACITPNRLEAGMAAGMTIETPRDGLEAARRLIALGIEACIVTLDRDGMAWVSRDGRQGIFPVRERQVYDITGAGDMVLSVIGYGLAAGLDYPQLIELANLAGGLEVEKLGVVPLSRSDLIAEIAPEAGTAAEKHLSRAALIEELARRRLRGQRIAMTNGCFDLLHPGHIASIAAARRQADCLVVGLNSDASVRDLKGPGRPIIDEKGRVAMLAALQAVDYVVVFEEASVAELVAEVRPDVLVKAAQYGPEEVVGHEIVASYGGRVVLAPMEGEYSTSKLIAKITQPGGS